VVMDAVVDKDMEKGEVGPLFSLNVERLVMCQGFVPNHVLFVGTNTTLSMSQKTVPTC